jgi:hypothetical protein
MANIHICLGELEDDLRNAIQEVVTNTPEESYWKEIVQACQDLTWGSLKKT